MFGFKPKYKGKLIAEEKKPQRHSRRLSLSSLRPQRSNGALKEAARAAAATEDMRMTRTRSLSNEAMPRPMISETLSAENINKLSSAGRSSQPLIHMLSLESEARRQRQEEEDGRASAPPLGQATHSRRESPSRQPRPQSLADVLLPMDYLNPGHAASGNRTHTTPRTNAEDVPRPSRLKFELPETPVRAKSPVQKPFLVPANASSSNASGRMKRTKSPKRSRWGIGGGSTSDASDDEELLVTKVTPVIGAKVELLRRPLPTKGVIKYVGTVNFAKGIWVGIELESRCEYIHTERDG